MTLTIFLDKKDRQRSLLRIRRSFCSIAACNLFGILDVMQKHILYICMNSRKQIPTSAILHEKVILYFIAVYIIQSVWKKIL